MKLNSSIRETAVRPFCRYVERAKVSALSRAVTRGAIDNVRQMVESITRGDLNEVDAYGMTALHYAAKHDRKEIVSLLLNNGASIDIKTKQGTALQVALRNRKEATASVLLSRGASATSTDADGKTALHLAVIHRLVGVCTRLLEQHMLFVSVHDDKLNTPLHYAAINNDSKICKALLDYGASLAARNSTEETALHLAAGEGNKEAVQVLLDVDFKDMNITKEAFINMERDDKKTALLLAAEMGNFEVIGQLICNGADIHSRSKDRKSALHLAVLSGNENSVRLLLERGISVDMTDEDGRMPLHDAVENGRSNIVEILLSSNAPIGHRDYQGYTPFLLAARNNNYSLVETLLQRGADALDQDLDLKTGLHYAVENNNYALSLMLVDNLKALIRIRDEEGQTPLHCAAELGFSKILKLLTGITMQVNDINNAGETALHLASRKGNVECVKLLSKDPKTLSICNQDDHTPLHLAAIHNKPLVCLALLCADADIDQRDGSRWSPLFYSICHDDVEVLKILLQQKADVNLSDKWRNTSLMIASEAGKANAVHSLLEAGADLQCVNAYGVNFFDLAIDFQRESVCKVILESSRWREALSIKDRSGSHFMQKLIKKYPDLVEIILNRSISFSDHHPEDPAFAATFDFQFLDELPTSRSILFDTCKKVARERKSLYFAPKVMFKYKRQQLTDHPAVSVLMQIKWNRLCRYVYYTRFLLFIVFNIMLNIYVLRKANSIYFPSPDKLTVYRFKYSAFSSSLDSLSLSICIISLLQILIEVFKMAILGQKYFNYPENYIEIALNASVFLTLTSLGEVNHYEHIAMALCIFLAWTNHLLYLQGTPYFNIYAAMYLKVCVTVVKLLYLFAVIFICFIITFSILKLKHDQFKGIDKKTVTLFAMMTGELGLNDWWFKNGKEAVNFPITTIITMLFFILFVVMAFTNLLIGLAVGDIDSIRSSAKLQAFKQTLRLVDGIQMVTPHFILSRHVNIPKYTYLVNRKTKLERLMKYLLSDTTDDDLKQLRIKQADCDFKPKVDCDNVDLQCKAVRSVDDLEDESFLVI